MTFKEALRVELKALAPTIAFIVLAHAAIMYVYMNGVTALIGIVVALALVKILLALGWTAIRLAAYVAAVLALALLFGVL